MVAEIEHEGSIIHTRDGLWYFWAEDWATEYGPYPTREAAETQLDLYIAELNREADTDEE